MGPPPLDIKYDFNVDLEQTNSHSLQLRSVTPGSAVLEFGCATGYLSRFMTEQLGCRVTGVELVPEYAERAKAFCEQVVVGDLDQLDLASAFGDRRFDIALFGDVLEHLKDPRRVLVTVRELLGPEGRVVATIPNVAHGDVRLALLAGRFEYRRLGLLDETHLRFFTLASIRELFEEAGYVIQSIERIKQPLFQTEIGVMPQDYPAEVVQMVMADPEATTYQYVIKARPTGEMAQVASLLARIHQLEADNESLRGEVKGSQAWAERVQSEYSAAYNGAQGEISALVAEVESLRKRVLELGESEHHWMRRFRELEERISVPRVIVRGLKALYRRRSMNTLPNEGTTNEG